MPRGTKVDPRTLLGSMPLFQGLSASELNEVVALTTTRLFEPREQVFRDGDPGDAAFGVIYGWLKASAQASDGRELTFSMMGPGEMFGELAILDGGTRSATVTVVEPALLLVLERARFHALLQKNASIAYRTLLETAARLRRLTGRMEDVAFLDVPGRLAKRLLELAGKTAPGADGFVKITAKLSQRELGELVGATRESVNRNLKAIEENGAIQRRGTQLLVSPDRLRALLSR